MKVFENDFGQLEYDEFAIKCCKSFELDYKTLSFILYKDFCSSLKILPNWKSLAIFTLYFNMQ